MKPLENISIEIKPDGIIRVHADVVTGESATTSYYVDKKYPYVSDDERDSLKNEDLRRLVLEGCLDMLSLVHADHWKDVYSANQQYIKRQAMAAISKAQ